MILKLHGYWRSAASYRVRIALNLKAVPYEQVTHDLRSGAQRSEDYRAISPQGLTPAIQRGDTTLIQSPAILEWLDECWPTPPLLPADPEGRAIVRSMAAVIACDIHPLNNLRVLDALRSRASMTPDDVSGWIADWIQQGFGALETMVARHGDGFAYGATPTLADCYLVPQVFSAERFGVDLGSYPRLMAATGAARALPAFAQAHPALQPDADPA